MWEDQHNKNGGRWLVNLNKQQRLTELDNFWQETVSLYLMKTELLRWNRRLIEKFIRN